MQESLLRRKGKWPMKGLRKGIFIVSLLLFVASLSVIAYVVLYEPVKNQNAVEAAQKIYHPLEENVASLAPPEEAAERKRDAFSQLKEGNPDTIGWIHIPNTVVDYPVMQSSVESPEFYLRRGYDQKYTKYGCIFLDAHCTPAEEMKNLTLYGHNMTDGQMFAAILQYTDLEFYKSAPVIDFDLEGAAGKWKVFSVFKTNTLPEQGEVFEYTQPNFADDAAFTEFIQQVQSRSILNIPVDVDAQDQLLTLSTCSYEFEEFRTVAVARRVRDGEEPTVNLDEAGYNPSPVYPDCWENK